MGLYRSIVIIILLSSSIYCVVFGQNSKEASHLVTLHLEGTALLGIRTGDIKMQIDGVTEAGAALDKASENSDTRLRITSFADFGTLRVVTAKLSQELKGTELQVQVLPPVSQNFSGERGDFTEPVKLTTGDNIVINNIGTCWSGTGDNDGYVIKYIFKINAIKQGESINIDEKLVVTVTFTLTDTK